MARPLKDVACMFCGQAPCECNAKPKAEPKKRAPRKKAAASGPIESLDKRTNNRSLEAPDKKAGLTAAMRASATSKHQGAATVQDESMMSEIDFLLADPEWVAAIQALEPLMHNHEKRRFERILSAVVDPKTRAGLWKARVRS